MSKDAKIVVGIMLAIIVVYVMYALFYHTDKVSELEEEKEKTSGEIVEEYIAAVSYRLESGENMYSLIATGSNEESITDYIFEGDKLTTIVVTEKLFSGDTVEGVYKELMEDETIQQIYSSIEIQGDSIIMKLKNDYVEAYADKSKEEIWEELSQIIEVSNKS